jgi:hypothetical protein
MSIEAAGRVFEPVADDLRARDSFVELRERPFGNFSEPFG